VGRAIAKPTELPKMVGFVITLPTLHKTILVCSRVFLVPTRRRGNAFLTRQRRGAASPKSIFLVPTRRRGNAFLTRQRRGAQAHKNGTLLLPKSVPTPARGNQKKTGRWRVETGFPRRRVGTRKKTGRWRVETGFPRRRVGTRKKGMNCRVDTLSL